VENYRKEKRNWRSGEGKETYFYYVYTQHSIYLENRRGIILMCSLISIETARRVIF